jgi:putative peptidoglycan lipid II flippase
VKDARSVTRATGILTAGTALSRITGLARVAALAYALGVTGTRLADTYNLANTTPNIIYELFLGGILTSVFIPVLVEIRTRKTGDPSALVSVFLVALAIVSALAAVAAPLVMRLYTFRVEDPVVRAAQLELATFLLRWFAPQIFFYGLAAIAQALLNVRGRFGAPSFAPVLNNLTVIATFLAFAHLMGEQGLDLSFRAKVLLGAGTTAGVVMQALILLPALRGEGLHFRLHPRDPAVSRGVRLSIYVVGYVLVNQLGYWVILALANRDPGGVTAYQVAYMFFLLPHSLFAVSLHTALFPDLSSAAASADWESYRRWFAFGVRGVAYLLAPAAFGYLVLAEPVTHLVLVRGLAKPQDAVLVASVLRAFALGLVFFSSFQFLTRCFYSLPDTRTPTVVNAATVTVNTLANLPLFAWLGVRGLALGHAIGYTTGALLLLVLLHRKVPGGLGLRVLLVPLVKISLVAAAMGACVWAIAAALPDVDVLVVTVCVGAGAILYLAFSLVAGLSERAIVVDQLPWARRR